MSLSTDYSTSLNQHNLTPLDLPELHPDARAVLDFWFDKNNEPYWFVASPDFDQQITDKFGNIWQAVTKGECGHWRRAGINSDAAMTNLAGRLAEIIVIDQFSRNLFRGQGLAFAQDGMALVLAQEAIHQPYFESLPRQWRQFMIIPFMHSESAVIHARYLSLFEQLNDPNTLDFEHRHQAIIEEFGRYPHRNIALNRTSSAVEREFLQQPDSSF